MQAPGFEAFEEKYTTAGANITRYIEAGVPGAAKVLLLHDGAFGTDAELCWGDLVRELADDYHVFAPELLGWGGSAKVIDFSLSRYDLQTQHLNDFCKAVGTISDPLHVVGTSFGGSLAVRMVTEETVSTLDVRSAVSLSGTGGPFRRPERLKELGDYTPSMEDARKISRLLMAPAEPSERHVRRRYLNSLTTGHWESLEALTLRNPSRKAQKEEALRQAGGGAPAAKGSRFPGAFASLRVPALLVEGTRDPIVETGWSDQLAAMSDLATAERIESGHSPNLDKAPEAARLIRAFFG